MQTATSMGGSALLLVLELGATPLLYHTQCITYHVIIIIITIIPLSIHRYVAHYSTEMVLGPWGE